MKSPTKPCAWHSPFRHRFSGCYVIPIGRTVNPPGHREQYGDGRHATVAP